MNKTTNKYSPEVRERAVRMVFDNQGQHDSRWSAIMSISAKIGCAPQTLNEWVKKAEVDRGERFRGGKWRRGGDRYPTFSGTAFLLHQGAGRRLRQHLRSASQASAILLLCN